MPISLVQWLKNGNPKVSTAKCLLMPFVALYLQKPFDFTLALQVFFTACESMIIKVVHLAFFSPVRALAHVGRSLISRLPLLSANVCSANRPLSRGAGLWASLASCNHSSVDKRYHPRFPACSSWQVLFAS